MEENKAAVTEETEDTIQLDDKALFDGWDDNVDDEDSKAAEPAKAAPPKTEKPAAEEPAAEKKEALILTLKHMDDPEKIIDVATPEGRNEATALARKGLDYDRQVEKNKQLAAKNTELSQNIDRYTEAYLFVKELADQQALSVDELIDDIRATNLAQQREIEKNVAYERVRNRRKEAAEERAAKAQTPQEEKAPEKTPVSDEAAERRQREITEFIQEYPTVEAKDIPKEVWTEVNAGKTLLNAYRTYENNQLKAELDALKKNTENKAKSTGSRATAGNKAPEDKWFEGWVD